MDQDLAPEERPTAVKGFLDAFYQKLRTDVVRFMLLYGAPTNYEPETISLWWNRCETLDRDARHKSPGNPTQS